MFGQTMNKKKHMEQKTHQTAVVLIPPEAVWPPIQALRQQYDRHVRRWMPHITLLYPFRPREEFERIVD
jgi:2'-5' RNA ligase superfamily